MKTLKTLKTLKMRWLLLLIVLISTIVVASVAIYYLLLIPPYLSSAETANRIENIYNRASMFLSLAGDDMLALAARNISFTMFAERMTNLKTDMTNLHAEAVGLRAVANQAFLTSIEFLERGLQAYVTALDYASQLDLESASQYLEGGTDYINQSKDALPTFT